MEERVWQGPRLHAFYGAKSAVKDKWNGRCAKACPSLERAFSNRRGRKASRSTRALVTGWGNKGRKTATCFCFLLVEARKASRSIVDPGKLREKKVGAGLLDLIFDLEREEK